ncbi:MAG: sulfatase-like hydrolase/transferase [Eubacterium sp.]|nr:sulfatase-like hydrolase/transferase [Eubacterium sp.]MDD7209195.1 sulfatase-like hydrolase/transferase [Lachnospiraceae bacterium]MDY5497064.1 sulfatase-like hydrolase/transferase [Anaerobutyricum sp.]
MSEKGRNKHEKKVNYALTGLKTILTLLLLLLTFYLCSHFMEYQKNATNQVNKYRIDQVCQLSAGKVVSQKFTAKHTHLKTVKIYFGNDYSGQAKGKVVLNIVDVETGQSLIRLTKNIDDVINNDYTEFYTNLQLTKKKQYEIRLTSEGAESGKEPLIFQWTTKEKGFKGKLKINEEGQGKYLVSKLYYPVTIYQQWAGICAMMAWIILLLWVRIPGPEIVQKIIGQILFFTVPLYTFWFVERFTDNPIFRMRPAEFVFNILLYYMFFGLLYLIFNSRKAAVTIGTIFWCIVGIANYYVLSFKGSPIVPSDIMSTQTAANVAANYTYTIQPVFVWNVLLLLLVLAVSWRCPSPKKMGWKKRVVMLLVIGLCTSILGHFVIEQKTLKSYGIKNNVWDQKKGYAKNGFFFGFVLNMNSLVQEKPADYSVEAAKDIAERYEEEFANEDTGKKKGRLETKDQTKPNVIGIMNEAFSDLSVINEFSTNQDYMPFIHGLKKNTIKGSLYMSIFGSGTCNSEFEFLTGNSMAFLQNGIIAYTQVVKDKLPNMTYLLKSQGYKGNLALHPYLASGWNRVEVYDEMGFEHFYSETDFTNPKMYRKYISDESDFKKIEELYENRSEKEEPFYLFNVTMQNHGGFDKTYSNFVNDVLITDNHKNEQAEQYLSLVKKTDEAFKQLVTYFSKVEEPTIIVMFGDHQPAIQSSFYDSLFGKNSADLSNEELMNKYRTPFIVWANYDIKETTIDRISANYLSAYIMKEAGLEMSPYQKFLLKLHEKLPVFTAMGCFDKDGNYYESVQDSPYSDMVKEYQILQYNNLIDTKNTVNSFFYLKKDGKK